MLAFGRGEAVCPGCRCRIHACVTVSDRRDFNVHGLHERSKKERCGACRRACGFVCKLAEVGDFVGAARFDPARICVCAGLSPRSTVAVVRALHAAMAEAIFDYQDQLNQTRRSSTV